ncbi:PIN domain-containing protein [Ammoniphilus sp. YIM 78166]|uniref:type II toxin-antitoxin system VapC family toxin n=1 Tax=Ammoniphilus sp. YIM 78166 TaxID=1644106 RepID=UPI001070666C|nr:PIN domain-containing protein [Ammoniphilus sp. YIM 78166]
MGIDNALEGYKKVALDTNIFIYAFEQHPTYGQVVKRIFDKIEQGHLTGTTSTLTLTEILVKPIKEGNNMLERRYKLLINNFPNLEVVHVDIAVSEQAALLRGKYGLKTPDAIQVASAMVSNSDVFISNDVRLEAVKEIPVFSVGKIIES